MADFGVERAGAAAVPIVTLLHELGHYVFYRGFGAPGLVLHFGSVSFDKSAAGLRGWQVAVSEAAGPLVSIGILWMAVLIQRRSRHAEPAAVAMGLAACLRFLALPTLGGLMILRWAVGNRSAPEANVDEFNAAMAAAVSPLLAIVVVSAIVIAGAVKLLRGMPAGQRGAQLAWLGVGAAVGRVLYFEVLGPRVLP